MKNIRKKKKASRPLTNTKDVLDIQDYLRYKNKRDYVLFLTGITTGYRAGDLVELQVRDIKEALRNREFTILENKKKNSKNIREKNRKARTVEIRPKLAKILKDYIKDKLDYEYVFQSRKRINKENIQEFKRKNRRNTNDIEDIKGHIEVSTISKILKEAGEYFGIYNISAHSMRKTYAYKIYLDSGKDIVAVKELLGHSSIEETKRYLGLDKEKYHEYSIALDDFIR